MFLVGLVNNIGVGVLVSFTSELADKHNFNYNFAMFVVFLNAVPILALFLNAYLLIQTSHQKRVLGVSAIFFLSYVLLAAALWWQLMSFSVTLAVLSVVLHRLASSIGEATVLGYIKSVPQEMVVTFSSGTGASFFVETVSSLLFSYLGWGKVAGFLVLALALFPYVISFRWIARQSTTHA